VSISADGRYVAFGSDASNLVPGDTNSKKDVFVRDTLAGTTERVSIAGDGTQGNSVSSRPSISADGRYVAFDSDATNLAPGDDTNGSYDVFVTDRQTDTIERVSVASDGTGADSHSMFPVISATGRYVAFHSYASNLVPGDTSGTFDVFVHDRGFTDRTPPVLHLPAPITREATSAAGAVVSYTVTATDDLDPAPTVACTPSAGSLFPPGSTSVQCTATDAAGNHTSATFPVTVRFSFTGFHPPVDNPPAINTTKAGVAIPVKFSLGGDMGQAILSAGSPSSQQVTCVSNAPVDQIEQTVTAGASSLIYDETSGTYTYVW
jgi:archaellum component FlaF (FlaF/FlaG flagellin family)